jgi:hypothetical protein
VEPGDWLLTACAPARRGRSAAYDLEFVYERKVVGRVTSAVRDPEGGVLALAHVHTEVPEDAELA